MQIILLERVPKLGQMGDVVSVKPGYARNFLIPGGKALRATKAAIADFSKRRSQLEARNLERKTEAAAVAAKLDGQTFVVLRQAGETGILYGSVNTRDIAAAITEGGFSVVRNQIVLDNPIKSVGMHEVKVQLHPEVRSKVTLNVARNADEAERQARGEDVTIAQEEEEAPEAADLLEVAVETEE